MRSATEDSDPHREILSAHTRDIDVAARFGGEEFLVLLPGCTSAHAEGFARRIRAAIATTDSEGLPTVRVSAGVVTDLAPETIPALTRDADAALYVAKRSGRDRIAVSDRRPQALKERPD